MKGFFGEGGGVFFCCYMDLYRSMYVGFYGGKRRDSLAGCGFIAR